MIGYAVLFFFQAEDGIRDIGVTGVQTCALPIFVVTAVTDRSKGTKGISSFILTKHTNDEAGARAAGVGHEPSLAAMRGFRAGKKEDKLGWRASDTCELVMEDVEVPAENLLGEEGQGFVNFMRTLDAGRIGIAALSLGIAEGAFEAALSYAGVRRQFGQPIASFQGVSFQLADMATEIEAEIGRAACRERV